MTDPSLEDESQGAMDSHRVFFEKGMEALEEKMMEKFGTDYHEAAGYVEAHFLYSAMRHASWSLHEDLRSRFYRLILKAEHIRKDAEAANKELVRATQEGASALVGRIEALKHSSDYWQKWLTLGTWALAIATAVLVWVEHHKH